MFSGCPSVCACVLACVPRLRHSPTGLPSTSSYFLLIVGGWNLQKYERNAEMTAMALHFIIPPPYGAFWNSAIHPSVCPMAQLLRL